MANERKEIRMLTEKYAKLQTLISYVNLETLKAEHKRQLKAKAVGVDKVTKEIYDANLESNLGNLLERMKRFSYRPKPVKRTYIPKPNGMLRPLGIPSYEDKLVQGCMANILKEIYEPKFMDCSYGFREGRSAHGAIKAISDTIRCKKVNYVLDCDIKGFFYNVNQEWLIKFLRHDIADESFIRYGTKKTFRI
ncbi:MAG: reverse transcriptase domain-containing protein [Candidatus Coproplasma sp.]